MITIMMPTTQTTTTITIMGTVAIITITPKTRANAVSGGR